jgi:DNA-damage-inducible protein D
MEPKNRDTQELARAAFTHALDSLTPAPPIHAEMLGANFGDVTVDKLIAAFEDASKIDDDGIEFWHARQLQVLLGYESSWQNFEKVVEKAKVACSQSGHEITDHFNDVINMVEIGSGAERPVKDVKLTRYAAYLVAQNGDSRKKPVAFAQTYFAIQARRQEIQDQDLAQYTPLSEDQKRLLLRNEIKEHNKNLASTAKGAGVVAPLDFAIFQNFGYKGLYGGLDRVGIQRAKQLKSTANILDHMGSTELAANLFRATQTEEKLRRENIQGKDNANTVHHEVGRKVRQAIIDIGGAMPEKLAPAEDIAKVGRRLSKAIAASHKSNNELK